MQMAYPEVCRNGMCTSGDQALTGSRAPRWPGRGRCGGSPAQKLPPSHPFCRHFMLPLLPYTFLTPLQSGSLACARATRKQHAASGILPVPLKTGERLSSLLLPLAQRVMLWIATVAAEAQGNSHGARRLHGRPRHRSSPQSSAPVESTHADINS